MMAKKAARKTTARKPRKKPSDIEQAVAKASDPSSPSDTPDFLDFESVRRYLETELVSKYKKQPELLGDSGIRGMLLIIKNHMIKRNSGCSCDNDTDENWVCDSCRAGQIVSMIEGLLSQQIESLSRAGLKDWKQKVFFDRWVALNDGIGCAALTQTMQLDFKFGARDSRIVATAFQFLGTVTGGAYLRDCQRQIEIQAGLRADAGLDPIRDDSKFIQDIKRQAESKIELNKIDFAIATADEIVSECVGIHSDDETTIVNHAGVSRMRNRIAQALLANADGIKLAPTEIENARHITVVDDE